MPKKIQKPRDHFEKQLVNIRMEKYSRPRKKEDWVARLKKKVKSYFKKRVVAKNKKNYETARTKSVTQSLKAAGLTDAEINRFRTKKR